MSYRGAMMVLITGKNMSTNKALLDYNSDKTVFQTSPEVNLRLAPSLDTPQNGKFFIIGKGEGSDIKVGNDLIVLPIKNRGQEQGSDRQDTNQIQIEPLDCGKGFLRNYTNCRLIVEKLFKRIDGIPWDIEKKLRKTQALSIMPHHPLEVRLTRTELRFSLVVIELQACLRRYAIELISEYSNPKEITSWRKYLSASANALYKQLECLGEGSQGRVFKVQEVASGLVFAAKVARGRHQLCTFLKMETDLLTALNHPNLIKLKELHSSPTQGAMLILELCECTLDNFFSTNRAARTQPNYHVLQVISQIGSALEFLQSKSIVHRDIKCSNILVRSCSPFHIVLGDFGTAYRASTWRTATSKPHGTVAYMAPEIFDTRITRADDGWIYPSEIWSLGVVAYRCLKCHFCLGRLADHKAITAVFRADLYHGTFDHDIMDLIGSMLSQTPSRRPSARQCRAYAQKLGLRYEVPVSTYEAFWKLLLDLWEWLTSIFMVTTHSNRQSLQGRKRRKR